MLVRTGDRLTDQLGRYSFAVPPGWSLDPRSKAGDVKIAKDGTHPYCWFIRMDSSPLSAREQFTLFKTAQRGAYKRYKALKERWGTIDGEAGGFLESRRMNREGKMAYAWNLVTVRESTPYVIDCEALEEEVVQVTPHVRQILDSFRWIRKP